MLSIFALQSSGDISIAADALPSTVMLINPAAIDQDDVCIWRDADDPERSLAITSDKSADQIFVYDLQGRLLQQLDVPKPGNIDIRQQVRLGGQCLDLVAVNQREGKPCLRLFQVDGAKRQLLPLASEIPLPGNYGGCLFHDRPTGRLYFIATAADGHCRQIEIRADAQAGITGQLVRKWHIGKCEGAAARDESAQVFITEERRGIWRLGARPDDPTPGALLARVGEHGLVGDLEGVALASNTHKMLVVSDQSRGKFVAFESTGGCRFVGEFSVPGVQATDGIEIVDVPLGKHFPQGLFACHNGAAKPCAIVLVPWGEVLAQLPRAE